jgi:hypothetical protein
LAIQDRRQPADLGTVADANEPYGAWAIREGAKYLKEREPAQHRVLRGIVFTWLAIMLALCALGVASLVH